MVAVAGSLRRPAGTRLPRPGETEREPVTARPRRSLPPSSHVQHQKGASSNRLATRQLACVERCCRQDVAVGLYPRCVAQPAERHRNTAPPGRAGRWRGVQRGPIFWLRTRLHGGKHRGGQDPVVLHDPPRNGRRGSGLAVCRRRGPRRDHGNSAGRRDADPDRRRARVRDLRVQGQTGERLRPDAAGAAVLRSFEHAAGHPVALRPPHRVHLSAQRRRAASVVPRFGRT